MTLRAGEFVRRFCLHLLPERFVKIRHYGLLANAQRQTRVAQARALLRPPTPNDGLPEGGPQPKAALPSETAPPRVCPFCGSRRLSLIEIVLPSHAAGPSPLRLDSS